MQQESYSEVNKGVIECYKSDLNKKKVLSLAEEKQLKLKFLATTDENVKKQIKNRFVEGNLRFAFKKAFSYVGMGLTLEDLIMEANLGLCRASEEYDFTKPNRFISYAGFWIQAALVEAIQNKSRLIRIPVSQQHKIAFEKYKNNGDSETLSKQIKIVNLSDSIPHKGDASSMITYEETTADPNCKLPDNSLISEVSVSEQINKFMETLLSDRELKILKELYGIGGEERCLVDIAVDEGLSIERVRQIGNNALSKLQRFKHKLTV